jgi:hypothetical protein
MGIVASLACLAFALGNYRISQEFHGRSRS